MRSISLSRVALGSSRLSTAYAPVAQVRSWQVRGVAPPAVRALNDAQDLSKAHLVRIERLLAADPLYVLQLQDRQLLWETRWWAVQAGTHSATQ
jgi:hypothetical protein